MERGRLVGNGADADARQDRGGAASAPQGTKIAFEAVREPAAGTKTRIRLAIACCRFPDIGRPSRNSTNKRLGFSVLIFLIVYALLLIVAKKKTCSRTEAHVELDTP